MDEKPVYKVVQNTCSCSRETCCCDDYKIMFGDELYLPIDSFELATEIVNIKNSEQH